MVWGRMLGKAGRPGPPRHPLPARAGAFASAAAFAGLVLAGCSSGASVTAHRSNAGTTTTTDALTPTEAAVVSSWRAAENAFYQAEADPKGLFSPALDATMVDPELLMVRRNLAGDEHDGFIGRGSWDLGSPRVTSLGPTEDHPTTATVESCIHSQQILINQRTNQPAPGSAGTPDWIGATSTMVLTASGWKLSRQSAVANADKGTACAGLAS